MKSTPSSWHHDDSDRGSLFHILISLNKRSIPVVGFGGVKGDKRTTCRSGCLRRALSCWGQQVGFLPSRDDAFYNEEVKKIIMEINSRTAVAYELCQAELWIWRAVLQCRAGAENFTLAVAWGVSWPGFTQPCTALLNKCVCEFACGHVVGAWLQA